MATKTVALKIDIQGNAELTRLQRNFDLTKKELKLLTKAERVNGRLTKEQIAERARLNVELKANRNALTDQQNAILKNNNALKKNSGFVAGIKKGIGGWATSMIGVTAAIAGVSAVIGNVVKTIKEFDQDMANLKAITGSTDEQMKGFRKSVLDVSGATGKGASEIAKAFQLVGSAKPELLTSAAALGEVTKQAVLLSQAGGMEVPEAASALTKAMNQFGAGAEDAAMFTDILATSQQKGTATIAQLSESLKNVGAVANSAGLTFEETNATLQALAKGGLVAGEAGTGLRGVILRLQKAGIGFKDGQFDIALALSETEKRFNSIQDPVELATEKSNLFGTENVKTIDTLIKQKDVLTDLNGQLNEYGNAAEQAAIVTNTIAGKQEALSSQWDRLILSAEEGTGAVGGFYEGILEFTEAALVGVQNLDLIFKNLFGSLKEFSESDLQRIFDTDGWETDAGLRISELASQFDKIPFDKLENNIQSVRKEWIELMGGDVEDADALFGQYVKNRISKEKELKKSLKDISDTNDESGDLEIETELTDAQKKAPEERAKRLADAQKKQQQEELKNRQDFLKKVEDLDEANRLKMLSNEEQEIEAIREKYFTLIEQAEQYGADKTALEEQLQAEEASIRQKYRDKEKEASLKERQIEISNKFLRAGENLEIQNQILEEERQFKLQNEDLTNAEIERLNLEYNNKIAENNNKLKELEFQQIQERLSAASNFFNSIASLAKEGSNEQKALMSAGAIINTYAAAAAALAPPPIGAGPIAGPLIAGAAIANGLSQVAKINAIQFADGGILKGASHANGGIPFTVAGRGGFEAEGGEAIINKRSTSMFTPLLSAINEAGGGKRLFQDGGLTPNIGGANALQQTIATQPNMMQFAETIIEGINDKQVVNVATETTDLATEVLNVTSEATF